MAREQSFTPQNGARPNVEKIAIVLTDGRSNDPGLTAQEAKLLKESGVLVTTVAIGRDILNSELQAIATLPEDVFHVDHFDALEAIEAEFTKQTCNRGNRYGIILIYFSQSGCSFFSFSVRIVHSTLSIH